MIATDFLAGLHIQVCKISLLLAFLHTTTIKTLAFTWFVRWHIGCVLTADRSKRLPSS
jgi:hypothetical protein